MINWRTNTGERWKGKFNDSIPSTLLIGAHAHLVVLPTVQQAVPLRPVQIQRRQRFVGGSLQQLVEDVVPMIICENSLRLLLKLMVINSVFLNPTYGRRDFDHFNILIANVAT